MSFLKGVLGGVVGAEMAMAVNHVLEQHGGLQGVVKQFETQGLGPTVKSWIGTGPNLPISAEQIQKVLGNETLQKVAATVGLNPQELAAKLTQVLPTAVDKMTPGGTLPPA